MKKHLMIFILLSLAFNFVIKGQETDLLSFNTTSIHGKVLNTKNEPIEAVNLEIALAPIRDLINGMNLSGDKLYNAYNTLKSRVGSGTFARCKTDKDGKYKINGVPVPGVYYLFIKNDKTYLPTKIKLELIQASIKEYKVPNMIARKRNSSQKALSEKTMNEIKLSRNFYKEKNLKKAVEHMKLALEISPKYTEGLNNLGIMYMADKKPALAIPCFEKYLEQKKASNTLNKKDSIISKNIASYYYQKKKTKKAIIYYQNAIELNSKIGADSYMYLGNSYLFNKDNNNAIKYYELYIKLYPQGTNYKQINNLIKKLKNTSK